MKQDQFPFQCVMKEAKLTQETDLRTDDMRSIFYECEFLQRPQFSFSKGEEKRGNGASENQRQKPQRQSVEAAERRLGKGRRRFATQGEDFDYNLYPFSFSFFALYCQFRLREHFNRRIPE